MKKEQPILHTQRLRLASVTKDHMHDLFEILGDEESMKYYDIFPYKEPEGVLEIIDLYKTRVEEGNGMRWGIFLENKLIGTCGFNGYKSKRTGVIGYDINRKYWGNGYASEAVKAVVEQGYDYLDIHRIAAHVMPGNVASEKVLQKCGFQKEGYLRDASFYKGKYQDQILYAKINENH